MSRAASLAVALAATCIATPLAAVDTATFGGLEARSIGPAVMGGRIASIAAVAENPLIIYAGTASGGVWRSKDGGITFQPVFDEHAQSIGAVAVDPSTPTTVWAGTGESWTRNSVSVGTGLYKSTDGGDTWALMGLGDSERIADILVHPEDGDTVWVCATGHLWDANEERGVYRTTDGGETWQRQLYVDADTGCSDLSYDPKDPDTLYAGMWPFRRQPWTFTSGGASGGLYKSTDGGESWTELTEGLPAGETGRIAVAVAPSEPQRVYAIVEAEEDTAFYRSDDAGASWEKLDSSFNVRARPFYFAHLVVDPTDHDRVYKPGLTLSVSRDGGESFTSPFGGGFSFGGVHPDHHALWIDPRNPNRLLLGTDGGIYESMNRGGRWRHLNNLPVSQVYRVAVDMDWPYNVYVGLQDNGSWVGPSRSAGGVRNKDWRNVGFGDGFWAFRDPDDPDVVYSEYQGGHLLRVQSSTGEVKDISVYPGADDEELRFNWNTPFEFGPSGALYVGAQYLFRSTDRGESWRRISPDLTTDDPEKQRQEESGGLTVDNSTAENHTTIYAVSESPRDRQVIWVGTDDGNLQVTRDGGEIWTNVIDRVPEVPENTWVSFVDASPHDAATAYVAFDGHRTGDMEPYAYVTTDYGTTWRRLGTDGVEGYAYVIRQDPMQPRLLFLGTEFGLWISIDGGESWARFAGGVPKVSVQDIEIHPRDHALVLGTHGRGVLILDDLAPLRDLTPEVLDSELAVLPSSPAVMVIPTNLQDFGAHDEFTGPNPAEAANLYYYLKKRHLFGDFVIRVLDADGEVIDELQPGMRVGINRVQWPMRRKAPKVPPGNSLVPAFVGPWVPEGDYRFEIVKGDTTAEGTVSLVADPRSPHASEDRRLQQETAMELYRLLEDLTYVAETLADLRDQARQRASGAEETGLQEELEGWADELEALREELVATHPAGWLSGQERLREKLAELYGSINGYSGRPTDSQLARIEVLSDELDTRRDEFEQLAGDTRLEELNARLGERELTPLHRQTPEQWTAKREGGG